MAKTFFSQTFNPYIIIFVLFLLSELMKNISNILLGFKDELSPFKILPAYSSYMLIPHDSHQHSAAEQKKMHVIEN
jgi:hypothetical protein